MFEKNAEFLYVKAGGTYSYHSGLDYGQPGSMRQLDARLHFTYEQVTCLHFQHCCMLTLPCMCQLPPTHTLTLPKIPGRWHTPTRLHTPLSAYLGEGGRGTPLEALEHAINWGGSTFSVLRYQRVTSFGTYVSIEWLYVPSVTYQILLSAHTACLYVLYRHIFWGVHDL
jgi:hypothetical protein